MGFGRSKVYRGFGINNDLSVLNNFTINGIVRINNLSACFKIQFVGTFNLDEEQLSPQN